MKSKKSAYVRPIPLRPTSSPEEAERSLNDLARQRRVRLQADILLSPIKRDSVEPAHVMTHTLTPTHSDPAGKTAFTTPPRSAPPLSTKFKLSPDSGLRRPRTPTKRRKSSVFNATMGIAILNTEPESAENSVEPLPLTVQESYQLKLTSSNARRCLFPSDNATFKQNHEVFVRSVHSRNKTFLAKKTKKWAYDFQKDEPLRITAEVSRSSTSTPSPKPIWTEALNAPKFYRTRGYVMRNNNKSSSPSLVESIQEKCSKKVSTATSPVKSKKSPAKRAAQEKKHEGPASVKKKRKTTPNKQAKITDTFSPRKLCKSISPAAKKKLTEGAATRRNTKGKKKLKL